MGSSKVLQALLGIATIIGGNQAFLNPWVPKQLKHVRGRVEIDQGSKNTRGLKMIDNFFRLHEKNRKMNFDELFTKARYDFPQNFASAAVGFQDGVPVGDSVKEALRQLLRQLPASANMEVAVVTVATDDEATLQGVLDKLAASLPGSTRVIGWSTGTGQGALSASDSKAGAAFVPFGAKGGIQITLASVSAVEFFPFFTSESQLRSWGVSPVAGLWEKLIGLGLNQAYKDAPLFFMFGRVKDQSTVDLALAGIDAVYSGTAKIGGAVVGEDQASKARLFSRLPGRDGAAIIVEEEMGVMGLGLSGDIRALVYSTQAPVPKVEEGKRWVVEAVSDDGQTVSGLRREDGEEIVTPAQAGLKLDEDLWLGLGGPDRAQKDEGADRWSFISVRGNKRGGVCVPAGQWALKEGGKSVALPRAVQQGMVLWTAPKQAEEPMDLAPLVQRLKDEIDNDWKQNELGVMRFRPSGVMLVRDPSAPAPSSDALTQLGEAVPTTFVGGFEAPNQLCAWDPETRSALVQGATVLNVFACKAKRRDPREVRFDYRRPWVHSGLGSTGNMLDLCFDPLKYDEATGELEVNRKAALTGTDVRVENMAWNVREERVVPSGLYEAMVWGKERELAYVREDAPLLNLMRTVMGLVRSTDPEVLARARGADVRGAVLKKAEQAGGWAMIGDVRRGSPTQGMLLPVYDPVSVGKELVEQHDAALLAIHVDQTYYGGAWQDLTDTKAALDVPVLADDLILYPYQTYLAKMFKADGVKLHLQVLTSEDLSYQIKICSSLFITPVIVASSLHQLRQASALLANSTNVVLSIDNTDFLTMLPTKPEGRCHVAAEWLADPEVRANLAKAAEPPVILIEGIDVPLSKEEQAELKALGVSGQTVEWRGDGIDMAQRVMKERAAKVVDSGVIDYVLPPKPTMPKMPNMPNIANLPPVPSGPPGAPPTARLF